MREQERILADGPRLGTAQIDEGSVGSVTRSVNLFRGEVNLSLDLVSLPGRNDLDVKISAFYSSNVRWLVDTWNRSAPTGVLGTGWTIPFQAITVHDQETGNNVDDRFFLIADGGATALYRTGRKSGRISFQSRNHLFWTFTYLPSPGQPAKERWEIVKEDGSIYIFGLHGIQWGVRWGNWTGSTVRSGGTRYPKAWNLVSVKNVQGDEIRFEYENDDRLVGRFSNQSYTRASRLKAVHDVYGRKAVFLYEKKEPFEVQPPHEDPDTPRQNAFQYDFEEKFLDRIESFAEDGALLSTTRFSYAFQAGGAGGDRYRKRYLTAAAREEANGRKLPATVFSYLPAGSPSPGALETVLYPTGGRSLYRYRQIELAKTSATAVLDAPGSDSKPSVWHGPDYTVVAWHQAASRRLVLNVYSWGGNWVGWDISKTHDGAMRDLRIVTEAGFFLLTYKDERLGRHVAFLYRQDDYRFGRWIEHDVRLNSDFSELTTATGEDFAAFYSPRRSGLMLLQWDGLRKRWNESSLSAERSDRASLAGRRNVLLAAFHDDRNGVSTVRLYHADADREWRTGWTDKLQGPIDWKHTRPEALWSLGSSFAAATYVTGVTPQKVRTKLEILRWREDFSLDDRKVFSREQDAALSNPIDRSHVAGNVIGNADHVYRFDGGDWQRRELGAPAPGREYGYVYGSDFALQLEKNGSLETATALQYSPYQSQWHPAGELRAEGKQLRPSVGGDYCLVGRKLFFRDARMAWREIHRLPDDTLPETIEDRAPFYIAFETRSRNGVHVLFLKDGRLAGEPAVLPGRIHAGGTGLGPGRDLAGPQAFVTYEGEELGAARRLRLSRIINESVRETQKATVVSEVEVDDGYGPVRAFYEYDAAAATYDPHGRVAQFGSVKRLAGSRDGAHGWTETVYFNGLSPDAIGAGTGLYPPTDSFTNVRDYFRFFNGAIYQTRTFDAGGRLVARTRYDRFASGEERGGRLFGVYARVRRHVSETFLHFFHADRKHAEALDQGLLPQELSDAFAARGLPLASPAKVRIEARGRRWTITQPAGKKEYVLSAETEGLAVYGPVASVTLTEHNDRGQPVREISIQHNADGAVERIVKAKRYAWEVYPQMAEARQLSAVAEQRVTIERPEGSAISDLSTITYRERWPELGGRKVWLPHKQYTWCGKEGTDAFDFAAWSGTGEPAPQSWLKTGEVTAVNAAGRPLESLDVGGLASSILYDARRRFYVATFGNASHLAGEATYWGFEEYEEAGAWRLPAGGGGTRITDAVCLTGRRCLLLPGVPAEETGLTGQFSPRRGNRRLVLFAWLRTEPGFTSDPAVAGWQVDVKGKEERTLRFPVPDTGGRWRHFHVVVDPQALGIGDIASLRITLRNRQAGKAMWLDHVGFAPVEASVKVNVYDPRHSDTVAELDPVGNLKRLLYDDLRRRVAEIGAGEVPAVIHSAYLWREHGAGFRPTDPNAALQILAREGGVYESFHTGESWRERWKTAGNWQIENRALVYTGGAGGRLDLAGSEDGGPVAVRLRISRRAAPKGDFGLQAGKVRLRWQGGTWRLEDVASGSTLEQAPAGQTVPREVLLLVSGRGVLAWCDGRPLLSRRFASPVCGAVRIFAEGPLVLDEILVAWSPVASLSFTDNCDQEIQSQQLDDDAVHVQSVCRDELGRPGARTKVARIEGALLGYRAGFARIDDWESGVLSGELNGFFPEDEGYPYWRTLVERSPLGRAVEEGAPGKANAIDLRVPAGKRRTVQRRYEALVDLPGVSGLPAGEYPVELVLDPEKRRVVSVKDLMGQPVAVLEGGTAQGGVLSRYSYDRRGHLAAIVLPKGAEGDSKPYTFRMVHDQLGRQIERTAPNVDRPYRYVYDRTGRLRFLEDAEGASKGWFHYWTYDASGRILEEGVCEHAWNGEALRAGADDLRWLPAPGRWKRRFEHDGIGGSAGAASLLGRLYRVRTRNVADALDADVEEWMDYDAEGHVLAKHLKVKEYDPDAVHTLRYRYDNLGQPVSVLCDAGAPEADRIELRYTYDGRAEVRQIDCRIGNETQPLPVVRYEYGRSGGVAAEVLSPGTAAELRRTFRYDPLGNVVEQADPFFRQTVVYGPQPGADAGDAAGAGGGAWSRIRRIESRFAALSEPGGFALEHAYDFEYDALGRLARAKSSVRDDWSLGLDRPITYDLHNNILELQKGKKTAVHSYYPKTDRLRSVSTGGAAPFEYDADGSVLKSTSNGTRGFVYDRHSRTVLSMRRDGGGAVELRYDVKDRRVLKKSDRGVRLYLLDPDGQPIVEKLKRSTGEVRRQVLVQGPRGLAAVLDGRKLYQVVTDIKRSTRAVLDGKTAVCAYNYLPHGDLMGPAYEKPGGRVTDYLFSGHERDEEVGLYHCKARLYDSELAMFYSRDPLSQLSSPYSYVGGDPVHLIDPSGQAAESNNAAVSGWAIGAVLAGIAAVVLGVVITVATLGAGVKMLVAGAVVGGALIGGGVAAVTYAASHMTNFDHGEFWAQVGIGAAAGAVGGLAFLGTAAIPQAVISAIFEVAVSTAISAASGLITNGVENAFRSKSFFDGWLGATALAAGIGAGLSLGSAVFGRAMFARAKYRAAYAGDRSGQVQIRVTGKGYKGYKPMKYFGHSEMTLSGNDLDFVGHGFMRTGVRSTPNYSASLKLPSTSATTAKNFSTGAYDPGNLSSGLATFDVFGLSSNNTCTTALIPVLRQAGLEVPVWGRTPPTLALWAFLSGWTRI